MVLLKKEEILHVAKLAKLNLSEAEIEKFTTQLSNVVGYVSELSEVDTKGVKPTSQTTGLENIQRADEANSSSTLTQEESLSGSAKITNGYFRVKAVLEGRTDK